MAFRAHPEVFCDWLSIYQIHLDGGLPVINSGCVVKIKAPQLEPVVVRDSGQFGFGCGADEIEFTTARAIQHEGSYDTAIQLRCDGYRVELSGNVSRYGRRDNLFGLKVVECVEKASDILETFGLPRFDVGATNVQVGRQGEDGGVMRSRPVITRVDLTANYSAGDEKRARRVLTAMAGHAHRRISENSAPRHYENGITWNEGSKRWYAKLYLKAESLGEHRSDEVFQFVRDAGVLRYEVSLKSRELRDKGLDDVVIWSKVVEGARMENVVYGKFAEIFDRNSVGYNTLNEIPGKLGLIARDYFNGNDVWNDDAIGMSTRRRYRQQLKAYGIDIATKPNVLRLARRVEVIEMQPLKVPEWYWHQQDAA